ncbi:MAG: thermonuclease family protein [Pseudolabrys sp.]
MAGVIPFRKRPQGRPRHWFGRRTPRRRRLRLAGFLNIAGFLALAGAIAAAAVLPSPFGDTPGVRAHATIIDGDTLRIGGERIRLAGIDAPERAQTCRDSQQRKWPCGAAARARLSALVSGNAVACSTRGHDRYGRALAVCAAGDVADLGRALVREGLAVAYGDYQLVEAEARLMQRGLWSGTFERPSDWRRQQ